MGKFKNKGRFYYGQKENFFRRTLIRIGVFFIAVFFFCQGINGLSEKTREEQKKTMEEALWRGITQCYALEGRYPQSLKYLKEEYGISYDSKKFFVDYQPLGENIMPDVTIIEKE